MKKGFTLIELLVVVLIIGILSSVALPQYRMAVERARMAEALAMMGSLKNGIDAYVLANGYEDVELVGNSVVILDVDAEASLDCSSGDDYCVGKHFAYDAYCWSDGGCSIRMFRGENDSEYEYALRARREEDNGNIWFYYCESDGGKIGDNICNNLYAQGWESYW